MLTVSVSASYFIQMKNNTDYLTPLKHRILTIIPGSFKHKKRKISGIKAFTIVELLVVLVILGSLMTILFVSLSDSGINEEQARFKLRADHMKLEAALFRFRNDTGRLPTDDEGLKALVVCPPDLDSSQCHKWLDNASAISDPWKNPYVYKTNDSGGYKIFSLGSDGHEGGEGSAADIDLKSLE